MARCGWVAWLVAAWIATMAACSSSSGGGSGDGSGSSSGGSGSVVFSCDTPAGICTQLTVLTSEVSSESTSCTQSESGTPGTGCPAMGLVGCCKYANNPSHQEQCYYNKTVAMAGMSSCTSMQGSWSTSM